MLDGFKLRYYPFRLLVYIIVLNTIGVLVISSATGGDKGMVAKQIFGVVLGLVLQKIDGTDVDSVWNMYYLAACSVTFRL